MLPLQVDKDSACTRTGGIRWDGNLGWPGGFPLKVKQLQTVASYDLPLALRNPMATGISRVSVAESLFSNKWAMGSKSKRQAEQVQNVPSLLVFVLCSSFHAKFYPLRVAWHSLLE